MTSLQYRLSAQHSTFEITAGSRNVKLWGQVMSVIYRALWSDTQQNPSEYLLQVRERFTRWASAGATVRALPDGTHPLTRHDQSEHVAILRTVEGPEDGTTTGVECVYQMETPGEFTTLWVTRVRVCTIEGGVSVWVETSVETEDVSRSWAVGRPRLVADLLSIPGRPVTGSALVPTAPEELSASLVPELARALRDPARTLPVVVVTQPPPGVDPQWRSRADKIATRCQAIALVVVLDDAAVTAFKGEMGDLSVWGGGIRVYAPRPVTPSSALRHRYTTCAMLVARPTAMLDRIIFSVAQMSTRARVPDCFTFFDQPGTLPAVTSGVTERERSEWEDALLQLAVDADEANLELAQKVGHLERLRLALAEANLHALFYGSIHESGESIPDAVEDTSEALLAAQTYLQEWVTVHEDAGRELEGIDTCPQSRSWGMKTWRGLRALAAYVQTVHAVGVNGTFWDWCNSGDPRGWPASSKHLSMTESDTVQNSAKLVRSRMLPVDRAVEPSGRIQMLAHLKIAEGGGDLAPRVYFHDDTRGTTGKVHIGFTGPHYLMRNTRS